ncbi:conserved hypothetical protein [Vibrio cholerae O1 str. 2010EL-1786]|uniref:Uncharacterized protein n=2 Tax=Vibrio cholerae TaxID=666 RepID=Q9KVK2_VIBCH|nr:hypothetical protein VC_0141 [Vibrio cholerae O1 biovar El Tor str. N16961]ACP04477.1 conserved hypothetical protein [Vibrio cholerae M66-2]ACP08067.1 conserved hypothetical protein [Vibrio cholerae O395]AET27847.1 conserved hypothetical protein [Vibrio cholerae O1 str. 2010EL-1786]
MTYFSKQFVVRKRCAAVIKGIFSAYLTLYQPLNG